MQTETAPHWLDAPTCEGWWWLKRAGYELEVVNFDSRFVYFSGSEEQCELAYIRGRWFGPLTPPEG